MSRSTPEWIGKDDDAVPPLKIRLRVFAAYGGRCHLSGRLIRPGDPWDLDHVKRLKDAPAGENWNRESNLAPALRDRHREKTAAENKQGAKEDRIRAKHLGTWRKPQGNARLQGRGFQKRKEEVEG